MSMAENVKAEWNMHNMSSSSYQAQFIIKKGEHSVFCFNVGRAVHVHLEILSVIVGRGSYGLQCYNY